MEDAQKLAFWQVKGEADWRRKEALLAAVVGVAISLSMLVGGGLAYTLAVLAVVITAGVAGGAAGGGANEDYKIPEPTLELLDEKYRVKATGTDGINALALIVAFKEQEHARAKRRLIFIGAGFGVLALAIGIFAESVLAAVISSGFAILFVAWASGIRNTRLKGFGVEVSTMEASKKSK